MTIDELKTTIRVLEAMQKGPNELQVKAAWEVVAREREKRVAAEKALRDLEIDSAEEITALKGQLRQLRNEIDRLNRSWQAREIERLKDLVETLVGAREATEPVVVQGPVSADLRGVTGEQYRKKVPVLSSEALKFLKK
jgi:hypothetical protein